MDRKYSGPRSYDCNVEIKQEDIEALQYMRRCNSNNSADSGIVIDTNSELFSQVKYVGMDYDNNSSSWGNDSQDGYQMKYEDMSYDDTSSMRNYGSQDGSITSPISPWGDSINMTSSWTTSSPNMSFSQPHHQHSHQQACSPTQNWTGSEYHNLDLSNQNGLSPTSDNSQPRKFVCFFDGCTKGFGRSADLDRHQKQVHTREEARDKFYCDYQRCQRKDGAFGRKDHFRDHFRDYHKEDIPQRGRSASKSWADERYINIDWWRCSKCLQRMTVAEVGYECQECRFLCEPDRKRTRERIREARAKAGQR